MDDERMLVRILREICDKHAIELKVLEKGWLLQLSARGRTMLVFGNRFPVNGASVDAVCSDKAALSAVLEANHVPHVPHWYFPAPEEWPFSPEGVWQGIQQLFDTCGRLVCKDDTGTGGRMVYRVQTQKELEEAVFRIYQAGKPLAVSPWCSIDHEYRLVVAGGAVRLCYEKVRQPGQWKHNLGQGASAQPVADPEKQQALGALALTCVKLLPLSFASIDLAEVNGALQVLEINSGVMMDNFAAESEENYQKAVSIYEGVVLGWFESSPNLCVNCS